MKSVYKTLSSKKKNQVIPSSPEYLLYAAEKSFGKKCSLGFFGLMVTVDEMVEGKKKNKSFRIS